ncbi:MAG: SDR family oxidoreductase [Chloroflexota bacterium]
MKRNRTGRLQDKVAIITGAASGIGWATVERFLSEGAAVVASDINEEGLHILADKLQVYGDELTASFAIVTGDVSQRTDTETIVDHAVRRFGQLDILVNSAGITSRTLPPEADFEAQWDAVMAVNAKGTMLMSYAAVEAMRKKEVGESEAKRRNRGSIINLASIMGVAGYPTHLPFTEYINAYPHSKGAVVQIMRDMGVRLAKEGIRINAVCPGFVYTALTDNITQNPEIHATLKELHPVGRMGEPEEIANVIAFLASDEASFVAAATWLVDGGYTAM